MSEAVVYETLRPHNFISRDITGEWHSYYDEPAYIEPYDRGCYYAYYGYTVWHRDDAPARIFSDNGLEYYNNGLRYTPKCQKL